jgi:hypothetical protein
MPPPAAVPQGSEALRRKSGGPTRALLFCTLMTKVQIRFRLRQPLDDRMSSRLSDAHALYGIQRLQVAPALDGLMVEYDATRLTPAEVESALASAGIPVERV